MLAACSGLNAFAGDRDFTYTYQSETEGKGHREFEMWFTYLNSGSNMLYNSLNHRAEFEVGLGHHLSTSFYLNLDYSAYESLSYAGIDTETGLAIMEPFIKKDFAVSFSNEWKWQMSSAEENFIGSALYGEVTVGPDKFELEGKLILDKEFGNWVTALNISGEMEYESELESTINAEGIEENNIVWENEKAVDIFYGLSYNFNSKFYAGLELMSKNEIGEDETSSALYAGPTLSYKGDEWWVMLTAMPMLSEMPDADDISRPFETRLIFAFDL